MLKRTAEQYARVWQVGYTIMAALPPREHPKSHADLGVALDNIDDAARMAFGFDKKREGAYVLAVRDASPAAAAGLRQGDLILAVDGKPCTAAYKCAAHVTRHKPGEACVLRLLRGSEELELTATLGARPFTQRFVIKPTRSVNAWVNGHEIGVTSGMFKFIESDDELAVVLGHEFAHITESHRVRRIGTAVVSSVVGATLGTAADIAAPGIGSPISTTTSGLTERAFSRSFEREADYKGLLHTFRAGYDVEAGIAIWERFSSDVPAPMLTRLQSTHPASPERMVRIKKIAASLKELGLEGTIAKYEGGPAAVQAARDADD